MKFRRGLLSGIAGVATAGVLALTPAAAFAVGGPGYGGGGGMGGGGGETETTTNNLSVPTIMVGSSGFSGVICGSGPTAPSTLDVPDGTPLNGYPIDTTAYYYVQGVNHWQAQCYSADTAKATAAWGDNLTGEAALRPGFPIRVELGLMNSDAAAPSMDGYTVVKLDPNALDRNSAYGTLATPGSAANTFSATPTPFAAAAQRVYDSGVKFSIKNDTTGAYVVAQNTTATAEINATGNVVYGYNLRVDSPGPYTITYTVPTAVTITGTDAGTFTANSVSLTINVTTSRGGGGGGAGGGGGGGGYHGGR